MGGGEDDTKGPVPEDLCIECSDDENYGPEKGEWEPAPSDIIELYEQLAKGDALELDWKCPGRRDPETDTNQV